MPKSQNLAIIGNGFDLNHGYNTDYKSFINNTQSDYLQKFKEYCEVEGINTWYQFEENIRIITEKMFLKSMSENCNFDDNRKDVKELAHIFRNIHELLKEYLNHEVSSKTMNKKRSIEKYLTPSTAAINFNYTKTVEAYTKKVFYIHGSIEENDIILGYDYRNEPCLAQFEDMQWSKGICRESLAFRRFYLKKRKYNPQNKRYKKLIEGLQGYHHWENTGRGLDDEVKTFIPMYNAINKFLRKYRKNSMIPQLNYKKIKTIVVLGHGIEADKMFLKTILEKCVHLEKVVIYRYTGEAESSYSAKMLFFQPYCNNIEYEEY